jgi:hypothetical protein
MFGGEETELKGSAEIPFLWQPNDTLDPHAPNQDFYPFGDQPDISLFTPNGVKSDLHIGSNWKPLGPVAEFETSRDPFTGPSEQQWAPPPHPTAAQYYRPVPTQGDWSGQTQLSGEHSYSRFIHEDETRQVVTETVGRLLEAFERDNSNVQALRLQAYFKQCQEQIQSLTDRISSLERANTQLTKTVTEQGVEIEGLATAGTSDDGENRVTSQTIDMPKTEVAELEANEFAAFMTDFD